jgi:hypothetical protein
MMRLRFTSFSYGALALLRLAALGFGGLVRRSSVRSVGG